MGDSLAKSFWHNPEVGFSFSNSLGRSGGLITLWNSNKVVVVGSFKGDGYLGNIVEWKNKIFYIINIYSSCLLSKKKEMWKELLDLKEAFKDGEWIMGGDFNATKNSSERKGRTATTHHYEEELFSDFIDKSLLVDVPCKGKKFTWFSGDGKSMSRLDRFLISSSIVVDWGVVGQVIGDRDISDHCPVWLVMDGLDWGPKPFRFNNEWFSSNLFIPFVEKEWKSMKVEGRGDFILKEKLRLLKDKLRRWNKEVFGKIELEMEDGIRDLNIADERLVSDNDASFDDNFALRKESCAKFWRNLKIKENMLLQKSRVKWIKEGDSNSGFFHKVMKQRRRINNLGPLFTPEGLVDSVEDVKEAVFNFFENKFLETEVSRPVLDGIPFNSINSLEAADIEKPFLEAEIKEALWECGGDKSPGPDGYSFLFIKNC
ncbi:uncharacterized protein LOC131625381 [Vicia villosa]|uniref:uncharacterized protein LOC131625381 n=1 Tax=Vicia villosa TaxID=3911 RepID=UPI00273B256B|nr:uncharacterized protein LOC131625381 [Vicia villosa]